MVILMIAIGYLVHLLSFKELHTIIILFNISRSMIFVGKMLALPEVVSHIVALLSFALAINWPKENAEMR